LKEISEGVLFFSLGQLLQFLFNIRMPKPVTAEFLKVQDEYLQTETAEKGITDIADQDI